MAATSAALTKNTSNDSTQTQWFALSSLGTLFFMFGFITCLNDILIPYLKGLFDLSYAQAMLVQFCFFFAYFVMSIPSGIIVAKVGYKNGIIGGLALSSIGCFMFYPAAEMAVYSMFLLALFVLASGITLLQVSANPYVSALGPSKTASSRLTLTQAFNSLGTTIAPFFGAWLIFDHVSTHQAATAESVQLPYLLLAGSLLIIAGVFSLLKLPDMGRGDNVSFSPKKVLQHRHLKLGAVAIFLYVGAEVAIGSFIVSYLTQSHIVGFSEGKASTYIAYYWGGAMVGRFIGALIMQYVSANKVLMINALLAILLVSVVIVGEGKLAMYALLSIGLCNSIMFPTIFSLAIDELGTETSHGASVLCLAIVGGAIVPYCQGLFADLTNVQLSFVIPVFCYLFIVYYGLGGFKVKSSMKVEALS